MCQEGKNQGEIRQDIPASAACIASVANMAAFVMYLEKSEQMPELDMGWMKEQIETEQMLADERFSPLTKYPLDIVSS